MLSGALGALVLFQASLQPGAALVAWMFNRDQLVTPPPGFSSIRWGPGRSDLPTWRKERHSCLERAQPRHMTRSARPRVRFHQTQQPRRSGGYASASYASGGGGTSRVPRIAGDVTAGPALVSCVLVSYAPCAERRRF
jgi:hypothetical protein